MTNMEVDDWATSVSGPPPPPAVTFNFAVEATAVENTSLVLLGLPHAMEGDSKEKAIEAKKSRVTLLKLVKGMNNDVEVFHFRSAFEDKERTRPDLYGVKAAPGWTSLSWGRQPWIVAPPAVAIKMLLDAAECVPTVIKPVKLFLKPIGGARRPISYTELEAMNLPLRPVPKLYDLPPSTGPAVTDVAMELQGLLARSRAQEVQLQERITVLERQLHQAPPAAASSGAASSSGSAAASSSGSAPSTPKTAGSKRARVEVVN